MTVVVVVASKGGLVGDSLKEDDLLVLCSLNDGCRCLDDSARSALRSA